MSMQVALRASVAILAEDTWSAIKGRETLRVDWDDAKAEVQSSDTMLADYRE